MMTDCDMRVKAGAIVGELGDLISDYSVQQLGVMLGDHVTDGDWRRVPAAVDGIIVAMLR